MREVQLEPDHEQQHGDADLGQQMDLLGGVDRPNTAGPSRMPTTM